MLVLAVREESHPRTNTVPRAESTVPVVVEEALVDTLSGSDGSAAIYVTEKDNSLRCAKNEGRSARPQRQQDWPSKPSNRPRRCEV